MLPFRALVVAIFVASGAFAFAFGTATALKRTAARESRQQPGGKTVSDAVTPSSRERIAQGRALFLASCAHCHGADARGDDGPDLHQVQVSNRYIENVITHGIPHE